MSSKHGSEKDVIFCPFYSKIGSCMHGDACSRMHIRPQVSKTLLLSNFYPNPYYFLRITKQESQLNLTPDMIDQNFDDFYVDIYEELRTFGPISDLLVAGNICDHMTGNVLVKYEALEDAVSALYNLRFRYYAGRPIDAQFSPVENFSGSICRQLSVGQCKLGNSCNFIHPKYPSQRVMDMCYLSSPSRLNSDLISRQRQQSNYRDISDQLPQRSFDGDSSSRRRTNTPPQRNNESERRPPIDREYRNERSLDHRERRRSDDRDDRYDKEDRYNRHDRYDREDRYNKYDREDRYDRYDKSSGRKDTNRNNDKERSYERSKKSYQKDRKPKETTKKFGYERDRSYRDDRY